MARRRFDDEDDDYDDRPRKRGGGSKTLPVLLIVGVVGVVFLACGGLAGGYFLFAREMSKPRPQAPVAVAPPAPVAVTPAPTDPPPANQLATVVLVRRTRPTDPVPKLEVTYRFDKPTGQFDQFDLVFELEGPSNLQSGKATVPIRAGKQGEAQTIQVEKELGFVDLSRARAKVWIQKRLTPAEQPERVSNVFRL